MTQPLPALPRTRQAIAEAFPGTDNRALRARLLDHAQHTGSVAQLRHTRAFTALGRAKLADIEATLQQEWSQEEHP